MLTDGYQDILGFMNKTGSHYVHIPMGGSFRHVNKCKSVYGLATRDMVREGRAVNC